MDLLAAALLGLVQGLTEFLPVSSSGHLILARALFGWDLGRYGLPFDVACHVGTLLAIVVYFAADIRAMIVATPRALTGAPGAHERLVRLIILGTIPVVIIALALDDFIESVRSPAVVAATLALGACGLLIAERLGTQRRDAATIGNGETLGIGFAQALALIPGVSRSGATLTLALLLGFTRQSAARFVFLLSMPAVAGAAAKEVLDFADVGMAGAPLTLMAIGLVASAISGYVTIAFFLRYLAAHSLAVFAYYRFALAAVTAVWLWTR